MQLPLLTFSATRLVQNDHIFNILQDFSGPDWVYVRNYLNAYNTNINVISARKGIDCEPFKLDHSYYAENSIMPDYDPDFDKSFEQVSDERALEIVKKLKPTQKILINWSGGVDSTVALVAFLRNCDHNKLVINLNQTSIYENPHFYYNFIENKIAIRNSHDFVGPEASNYLIINGQPELPVCKKYLDLLQKNSSVYDLQFADGYKIYIDCFVKQEHKQLALKNYEKVVENIKTISDKYPIIETLGDFIWWEYFNYYYKGKIFTEFYEFYTPTDDIKLWSENFICWYDSPDYQRWIMKNKGPGKTHGKNLSEFKLEYKKYIYNHDQNDFYFKYKTKMSSTIKNSTDHPIVMTTSDFRNLTIEENFDEVVSFLPSIINNSV